MVNTFSTPVVDDGKISEAKTPLRAGFRSCRKKIAQMVAQDGLFRSALEREAMAVFLDQAEILSNRSRCGCLNVQILTNKGVTPRPWSFVVCVNSTQRSRDRTHT